MIGMLMRKIVMVGVLVLFVCPLAFAAKDLPSAFTEGKASGTIKVLSFSRDFDTGTDWSSLAIGGILNYKTAPLAGFSIGVGFKTSQAGGWQSDSKNVYSGILTSSKDSYSALSEYYLQYEGFKTKVKLGAQYLNTPWVNGWDVRMTPLAYRGIGIINKSLKSVTLQGYYLDSYMGWTSETWQSMASGLSKNLDDDGGAFVFGADLGMVKDLKIRLWYYLFQDVMNNYYFQGKYKYKIGKDFACDIDFRYLKQDDSGDELAGAIDTYTAGGWVGFSAYGAKLSLGYAKVGDEDIKYPFGHSRIITQQVYASNWAKSDVYAAKLAYNFSRIGAKGLSAYVFYGNYQVPDDIAAGKYDDTTETDFSLKYKFDGALKGLSAWARYAIVDKDEATGGVDFNDLRFYLEYKF